MNNQRENFENFNSMSEEKRRNLHNNARNNSKKPTKKKKNNLRKKLAIIATYTALVSGATATIFSIGSNAVKRHIGEGAIGSRFDEYAKEYSISDSTINGSICVLNGKQISFDSVVTDIINDAKYDGMSDAEIYIGLSEIFGSNVAKQYGEKFSSEDLDNVKLEAYHAEKAEEYGKIIGGFSK